MSTVGFHLQWNCNVPRPEARHNGREDGVDGPPRRSTLKRRVPLDLPRERPVRIMLPTGAALRVCGDAEREWGAGAVEEVSPGLTRVSFWMGGRRQFTGQSNVRPVGGFWVRWDSPTPTQATIERLGWDPAAGSSELEVRQIIDVLAGWPVATRAQSGAA